MKKFTMLIMFMTALFLMTGCGGGDDAATHAEDTAPATEAAPVEAEAAPAEAEAVVVHDCAGPCGMKDVPEAELTEVNGKFFCAGCVDKAKEAAKEVGGHG